MFKALLVIFLVIYCIVLFFFWVFMLADDGDFMKEYFNKYHYQDLTKEEYIKILWLSLFWPIVAIYLFIKNKCTLKIIKFIWKIIKFIFEFIFYPFILLYKVIFSNKEDNKKEREPFKDKLGKFIVKVFKL